MKWYLDSDGMPDLLHPVNIIRIRKKYGRVEAVRLIDVWIEVLRED